MKKFVLILAAAAWMASCGNKIENSGEGTAADSTKSVADTTSVVPPAEASVDTSKAFACNCEHKCATKEECETKCGPDCMKE